jgi:predicted HAD superfamily Cof-like phosphohydrolase
MLVQDTLDRTAHWFHRAVPEPTDKNLCTQVGCHFEEVAEMLEAMGSDDDETAGLLSDAEDAIRKLSHRLKTNEGVLTLDPSERVDLLDALCDQIVTAVGVGHMWGLNVPDAMNEVNASNWSKFVDGRPVFDANRKIQKGPYYRKANLIPFLGSSTL